MKNINLPPAAESLHFLHGPLWFRHARPLGLFLLFQDSDKSNGIYNILWAVVFGFATINILGLVAKRFEPTRNRLSFGEIMAIMVVVVSVGLLGWEMLFLFHVLPIKLQPR